jgi:hypothetical protein
MTIKAIGTSAGRSLGESQGGGVIKKGRKGPFQTVTTTYFFLAFGLGKSVMLPSYISAAKPIDSLSVG